MRGIEASGDRLTAVAYGDVEVDDGVLVIRRILVVFALKGVDAASQAAAERAHEVFKPKCPVYRSIHRAIDITTELKFL